MPSSRQEGEEKEEEPSQQVAGESLTSSSNESIIKCILSSRNSYEIMSLAKGCWEPSTIRRQFLVLALKVHPDKQQHQLYTNNNHKNILISATEAFQKLSSAFEMLYNKETQKRHLEEILSKEEAELNTVGQQRSDAATRATEIKKRKQEWREKRKQKIAKREQKKQKRDNNNSGYWSERRSWEDIVTEMKRREELERNFLSRKSNERLEKRIRGLIWQAMKLCRNLDLRAGCPPTFINGLWAPLYEHEVLQSSTLPDGWTIRYCQTTQQQPQQEPPPPPNKRIYRYVTTGEEFDKHPIENVERLLQKARTAELTNKYRCHTEPRLFLNEIVEYLRDDHNYNDMDDDILELEEEERARANHDDIASQSKKEYDY